MIQIASIFRSLPKNAIFLIANNPAINWLMAIKHNKFLFKADEVQANWHYQLVSVFTLNCSEKRACHVLQLVQV